MKGGGRTLSLAEFLGAGLGQGLLPLQARACWGPGPALTAGCTEPQPASGIQARLEAQPHGHTQLLLRELMGLLVYTPLGALGSYWRLTV